MIAATLVVILLVIRAIGAISAPYSTALTVVLGSMPNQVEDQGNFKLEVWLEDNGDGTYKVNYRIWAVKDSINGAKVQLVCFGPVKMLPGLTP